MGEDGWISMLFPVRPTDAVRLKSSETTAVQEGLGNRIYISIVLFHGAVVMNSNSFIYSIYDRIAIK